MIRISIPIVAIAMLSIGIGGCAVVAVADAVGTVAVKTVGVAADAAIGTVKVAGKVVGKAADATLGSDQPAK
ncbi:MAG: hypothetical protein ACR2GP_04105 [Burkholderiaceae bacterium]